MLLIRGIAKRLRHGILAPVYVSSSLTAPVSQKGANMNFTEQKLEKEISNYTRMIASILAKGHDVELRKTTGDFLKIVEVRKTIKN